MQIRTVTIHNFRSIVDGRFSLNDYSLLIGANNSGKSNIIDALRVFYEKDGYKYDPKRDRPLVPINDEEAWIEIVFVLNDDEAEGLKGEYLQPGNLLRVRKVLAGEPKPGIYAYEGAEISKNSFYGAKPVQQGKLGEVIYIQAVSRLEDETKLSGPSPLRDLLSQLLTDVLEGSTAFAKLTKEFQDFAQTVKCEQTDDERSISRLETEISNGIAEWDTEFNLSINPVDKADIIKNLVGFEVIDKALQQATDPRRQGQGFQRHLVYTLIRLAAKYQTPAAPTDRKEFKPSLTLYLFEEPEAFLHPTQQDVLCRSLKKLAAQEGNQVLLTSHSPHFVSHNTMDIPSIIRLSRPQARTLVGQIDQSRLEAIFADNQAINALVKPHDDDYKLDMEAIKYFLWLGPERCGVFFSRHVLMVEGPTEYVLLRHLIDEGRIEPPTGGVFILDCMGKYNFHRFMHILGALNVSHSILFDGDANKPPHDRIHRLICETCNGHTKEVAVFPDDIETFLGIEEPKETRRKPQHLMLQLREGAITEERIDALVALVDRLIRV